ncbi:MAG: bifunctional 3-phenylpropionate/cinnamic acid dioxygenase ferredoxin subunit [Chloroflexi bacterium]|nr:MAG: bifunctional 3-phenylpropionate/cinnamic acid dioxygenase ferredoxin subunit [Chloroflexota bacterium]
MSALRYPREEGEPTAPRWVTVGRTEDIPAGHAARVDIHGTAVAIVNCNGELFAIDDTCSHAEASLSEGELYPDECAIECPLHGSTFNLRTGEPLTLPAVEPVRAHRIAVEDGLIKVALEED